MYKRPLNYTYTGIEMSVAAPNEAICQSSIPRIVSNISEYMNQISKKIKDLMAVENDQQINENAAQRIFKRFPSEIPVYNSIVRTVVQIGKAFPHSTIDILISFNPFSSNPKYSQQFIDDYLKDETNPVVQQFYIIFLSFFFADALSSIVMLEDEISKYETILNAIVSMKPTIQCPSPFDVIYQQLWHKILKQLAVIVGQISFKAEITKIYHDYLISCISEPEILIVFRYVRLNKDMIDDSILNILSLLAENHKNRQYFKLLWSSLPYHLYQLDNAELLRKINDTATKYVANGRLFNKSLKIMVIIKAKLSETEDEIYDFLTEIQKYEQVTPNRLLKYFLILLRGKQLDHELMVRKFYSHDQIIPATYEEKFVFGQGIPIQKLTKFFVDYYFKMSDTSDKFISSVVLYNLACRDQANGIEIFNSLFKKFKVSENADKILPMLEIIQKIGGEFAQALRPQIDIIISGISTNDSKYLIISPNLTKQNCPKEFPITYNPKISNEFYLLHQKCMLETQSLKKKLDESNFTTEFTFQEPVLKKIPEPDNVYISCLTLICLNMNGNEEYVTKLLCKYSFVESPFVSHFVHFALQFFYIRFEKPRNYIIKYIFRVLRRQIDQTKHLTFLILLEHLLSISIPEDINVRLHSAIIYSLAFPVLEIREVAWRLTRFLPMNETNFFKFVDSQSDSIYERFHDQFPSIAIPTFEEIKFTHFPLYSVFYSEILVLLSNIIFEPIVSDLIQDDLLNLLKLPSRDEIYENERRMMIVILVFRLQMFSKEKAQKMTRFYSHLDKFELITVDNEIGIFSKFIQKPVIRLLDNFQTELRWPVEFIGMIIKTSSIPVIELLMPLIMEKIETLKSDSITFQTRISYLFVTLVSYIDVKLLFQITNIQDLVMKYLYSVMNFSTTTRSKRSQQQLTTNFVEIIMKICELNQINFYAGKKGSFHHIDLTNKLNMQDIVTFLYEKREYDQALISIFSTFPVFKTEADYNERYRRLFSKYYRQEKVDIYHYALLYHPFLFDMFISRIFEQKNVIFFKAIVSLYYDEYDEDLDNDSIANKDAFEKRGILILIALLFLEDENDLVLGFIKKLFSVYSAYLHPHDSGAISVFRDNLNDNLEQAIDLIQQYFPQLVADLIEACITQLKKGLQHQVLDILSITVRQTRLTSIDLLRDLVSFSAQSSHDDDSVLDFLFSSLLQIPANILVLNCTLYELCSLSIEGVAKILFWIAREEPQKFMKLVVEPLTFGRWWFDNIYAPKRLDTKTSNAKLHCSLSVILKIAKDDWTRLALDFPVILTFFVMFEESKSFKRQIRDIQNVLIEKMELPSFSVPVLCKKLDEISPALVETWSKIALQWFTQCADNDIASKASTILWSISSANFGKSDIRKLISKKQSSIFFLKSAINIISMSDPQASLLLLEHTRTFLTHRHSAKYSLQVESSAILSPKLKDYIDYYKIMKLVAPLISKENGRPFDEAFQVFRNIYNTCEGDIKLLAGSILLLNQENLDLIGEIASSYCMERVGELYSLVCQGESPDFETVFNVVLMFFQKNVGNCFSDIVYFACLQEEKGLEVIKKAAYFDSIDISQIHYVPVKILPNDNLENPYQSWILNLTDYNTTIPTNIDEKTMPWPYLERYKEFTLLQKSIIDKLKIDYQEPDADAVKLNSCRTSKQYGFDRNIFCVPTDKESDFFQRIV